MCVTCTSQSKDRESGLEGLVDSRVSCNVFTPREAASFVKGRTRYQRRLTDKQIHRTDPGVAVVCVGCVGVCLARTVEGVGFVFVYAVTWSLGIRRPPRKWH